MQEEIDTLKTEQQSVKEKEAQLTEMIATAQKDTDTLEKVLSDATSLLQRNSADFGVEMEQMRQETETLRGQVEELKFSLQKIEQSLKLFKEDTDIRFSQGEGVQLPSSSKELWSFAQSKFKAKDYKTSRRAFQTFVSKFPKDRKAANAHFLLGESFFQSGQYVSAVGAYQSVLQSYGRSKIAGDATYRIGESFFKLGKCKEASVFFESVVKDHKKSKWRSSAKKKLKLAKAGKCS